MKQVKKGYKQTEVGVIPEDWETPAVGSVCKLINGRGFKPYEWEKTGIPIIRIQNLNGSEDFNCFRGNYDPKLEVVTGQLLFAWSGSRGTSFGPHIWQGPLGLLNYHTWKVLSDQTKIKTEYLFHVLKQLTTFIESKAHGASALVHTQKWEMEGFKLPLPPTLAEQEAIAGVLSDVDALISSLENLITKKRHIKQAAMQELLRPKEGWVEKKLGDFLSYEQPTKYIVSSTDYEENGQVPVLTAGKTFVLGYTNEEHGVYNHHLPVIIFDDFTTSSRYVDFPFKVKSSAIKILAPRNPVVNLRFIFELMQRIVFPLGDHKRHWIGEYQHIDLKVPDNETQSRISGILTDMDAEITALEKKLAKTRQLKQGMMAELLTGRIRLTISGEKRSTGKEM